MASGGGMSGLSCGARIMKFILVFFNMIFLLLGLAILGVGLYLIFDPKLSLFSKYINPILTSAGVSSISIANQFGIAFCIFGGFMCIISFLGCCGAVRQIKCLLGFYSIILLVLLVAEIGIGIFAGVYATQFQSTITSPLKISIRDHYQGDMSTKDTVSVGWDILMYNFQCCGINNSSDFNQAGNIWTNRSGQLIPRACCKFTTIDNSNVGNIPNTSYTDSTCYTNPTDQNSYQSVGCYNVLNTFVHKYSAIVVGIAVGFGLFLLLGVVFGFHLCRRIGDLEDVV